MDSLSSVCPGATLGISALAVSGTVSFRADNTVTSTGSATFLETIFFPTSCLTAADCTSYESTLSAAGQGATCSYNDRTGCSCSVTVSQSPMSTGTYQAQGSEIAITDDLSDATEISNYCATSNTVTIHQDKSDGSSATLILTK